MLLQESSVDNPFNPFFNPFNLILKKSTLENRDIKSVPKEALITWHSRNKSAKFIDSGKWLKPLPADVFISCNRGESWILPS